MKIKNIIKSWTLLSMAVISVSCIESYEYEKINGAPQIAFFPDDLEINRQYGATISIKAIVVDGDNVQHQWKFDDEICGEDAGLEYKLQKTGTHTLLYTATDKYGKTEKRFTVNVKPADIEGIVFSTDKSSFEKSIGESLRISVTVLGEDVYNHEWKVNGEVYSTTTDFDFPIIEKGDYEILYTIKNDNAESQKKFTLSAGSSQYNDRWLYWPLLKQFVITLKDDPTKAVTFRDGMTNPVIESYTGSDNQKFVNGGGWGYSDPNISLEYSTIYNVAAKKGFNEKFTPVDKTLNEDGSCSPDSWSGWYFPVDEHGNARIVHFLETWDYSATYTVAIKGVLWSVSEDKLSVQPVFYDRCKVDGERDHSDYEALEGQYYDFKLVAVEDMQ